MSLVWVTGASGVGKSTVCAVLKARDELAVDADGEGYNHWVDRASGQVVAEPPDPVPAGCNLDPRWWSPAPATDPSANPRCRTCRAAA